MSYPYHFPIVLRFISVTAPSYPFKRNPPLVFGVTFERFCDWYLSFSCPKHGHGQHRDRVCCLFFFLSALFWSRSMRYVSAYCTGTCIEFCREANCFRVRNHIRLGGLLGAAGMNWTTLYCGFCSTDRQDFRQWECQVQLPVSRWRCVNNTV